MIYFRRVVGNSMYPTLQHGQIVCVHQLRNFKEGQVVVAYVKGREVIKRITRISGNQVYLEGDNPESSTDSRSYGPIIDTHIDGVVFWPRTVKKNL